MSDAETIVGRYRILDRIGRGGMAEVFLANQVGPQGFERLAVLKRLIDAPGSNSDASAAFADEARLAACLQHPNIVRTEDFFEFDGSYYMVLEHIPGEPLHLVSRHAHAADRTLPLGALVQVGVDIAKALDFAHAFVDADGAPLGIVHRDVSPHNIMLTPSGTAKLLDFGIASSRSNRAVTRSNSIRGKVLYFSPEQAAGHPLDGRSDQFSLALVLYECLSRAHVFGAQTLFGVLKRVERCTFPPISDLNRQVPPRLCKAIGRALSKDVLERFRDCGEFAAELSACLQTLEPAWQPARYAPWREALLAQAVQGEPPPRFPSLAVTEDAPEETVLMPIEMEHTQITAPGVEEGTFESMVSEVMASNLRPARNLFVGRGELVREVTDQLQGSNAVVSLVGMGGMGKTRLSEAVADDMQEAFDGGIWFCELVNARSHRDLVHTLAAAMSVPLPARAPLEHLCRILAGRPRTLVILDTAEHLLEVTNALIDTVLENCHDLAFMVTTRMPLGRPGERVFPVTPLGLADSMELFFDRAKAAGAQLDDSDVVHFMVRNIVTRVQGHALAIELAAARCGEQPLEEIANQLDDGFELLGADGSLQQSHGMNLWTTIEWSWGLLSDPERTLLAELSVFKDGFDEEAVAQVTTPADSADLIHRLVESSLVSVVHTEEAGTRYAILGVIRAFASERLGERLATLQRLHFEHYAGKAVEGLEKTWWTDEADPLRRTLLVDLPNLRLAAENALAQGAPERAAGCAICIGLAVKGERSLEDVEALLVDCLAAIDDPVICTRLHLFRSRLAVRYSDQELSRTVRQDALAYLESQGNEHAAEVIRFHQSRFETMQAPIGTTLRRLTGHIEVFRALGDQLYESICLGARATVQPALEDAVRDFQRSMELARSLGFTRIAETAAGNLGNVYQRYGLSDKSKGFYQQAIDSHIVRGDRRSECLYRANLGNSYRALGEVDEALEEYRQALSIALELGLLFEQYRIFMSVGNSYRTLGRFDRAMTFYQKSISLTREAQHIAYYVCEGEVGHLKALQGNFAGACGHYRVAIEGTQGPRPAFAAQNGGRLAAALAQLGDLNAARTELASAWERLARHDSVVTRAYLLADAMIVCAVGRDQAGFDTARSELEAIIKERGLPEASLVHVDYTRALEYAARLD